MTDKIFPEIQAWGKKNLVLETNVRLKNEEDGKYYLVPHSIDRLQTGDTEEFYRNTYQEFIHAIYLSLNLFKFPKEGSKHFSIGELDSCQATEKQRAIRLGHGRPTGCTCQECEAARREYDKNVFEYSRH